MQSVMAERRHSLSPTENGSLTPHKKQQKRHRAAAAARMAAAPMTYVVVGLFVGFSVSHILVTMRLDSRVAVGLEQAEGAKGGGANGGGGNGGGGGGDGGGGGAARGSAAPAGGGSADADAAAAAAAAAAIAAAASFRVPPAPGMSGGVGGRRAYAFYAAQDNYFCSALVNIQRLKDLGAGRDAEFVIVLPNNYSPRANLLKGAERLGVKTTRPPPLVGPLLTGYYRDCMAKLHVFNLTDYKRLVFLDSDSIILRNLDGLFDLPEADLSAPRAYWLDPGKLKPGCGGLTWRAADGPQVGMQMKFTSAVMVINPSARMVSRIFDKYFPGGKPNLEKGVFDMDLLNIEFKDEAVLLRGESILALSAHWSSTASDPVPSHFKSYMSREDLYRLTGLVHFSPTKPWMVPTVRKQKPGAHPLFYEMHELWTNVSRGACA